MASSNNSVTFIGQLTADPELRHTKKKDPVASFSIAHNGRLFDRDSEEWVDGDPTFLRCSLWREYGENFAESVSKGDRVFVIEIGRASGRVRAGTKREIITV